MHDLELVKSRVWNILFILKNQKKSFLPASIRLSEEETKSARKMRRKEDPRIVPASIIESLLMALKFWISLSFNAKFNV